MTILSTDIKLLASERMTDTSDGGGRRTSAVIPDGVPGNIFPKVSRLDSVYGRVNLRKIFGQVTTANVDTYAGAMAVVMTPPANDRIHVNLFSTDSSFDDRTAARDRIESYLIAGPESRMTMYGRQLVGQAAILAYQMEEDTLPEPGDVYCLSSETGGVTGNQQYVRVTDVTHEVRTFTDAAGSFKRRVMTLKLNSTLRFEFTGPDTPSRYSSVVRPTLIRRTNVADASRYFGVKKVSLAGESGDLTLKLASVYSPIVPSTQRETPVSDVSLAGALPLVPAGLTATPFKTMLGVGGINDGVSPIDHPYVIALGRAVVPGSLALNISNYNSVSATPSNTVVDDEVGSVPNIDWVNWHISNCKIDYASGVITLDARNGGAFGMRVNASYIPAAPDSQTAHTHAVDITTGNRGTVQVQTLLPPPTKGTLVLDFRALGKWYRLRDNGLGVLVGDDPAYGTGSINYTSGAMVATLGSLPDVGSAILTSWGSSVHYVVKAGASADVGVGLKQELQLPEADLPVALGSPVVTWVTNGVTKTATTTGVTLSGHASGTLDPATGVITMTYNTNLPDIGSLVTVAYNKVVESGATPTRVSSFMAVSNPASFTLPQAVAAGSLHISAKATTSDAIEMTVYLTDDGSGNVRTGNQDLGSSLRCASTVVGTVNYATGVVSLTNTFAVTKYEWKGAVGISSGVPAAPIWGPVVGGAAVGTFVAGSYTYRFNTGAAGTDSAVNTTFDLTAAPLKIDLTATSSLPIVPGSIRFAMCGRDYVDRAGVLYHDYEVPDDYSVVATGEVGAVDYTTGLATLHLWLNNKPANLSVQSCLTYYGQWTASSAHFRTSGSPLRPGSAFIQVTSKTGELLTASANEGGIISGGYTEGTVDQETGVVAVRWGEWLTAAGNELEPWYDADNVVGANVWKPREVFPDTLRYNCVVLSNLPLSADVLGLDPVRLPSDGRVPIYRPADVVVIHNTKILTLPNPAVASAVYSMGRTALSELWLLDATGARVPTGKYIVGLSAGTVTMAADLDLTGIPQPLVAKHRIEELNLLSDVQINGQVSLTGPLTRDYDLDTYVSSALLFGDMFARVTGVFDQATWTNVWSDALIGSQATAQYNTIDHPIEVLNNGCVRERWRINFTSTTAFQVIGESLGVIATGSTAGDLSPTNGLTGLPYFSLRAAGWGTGWSVGNQLRFNTLGATAPTWVARTVLPGATLTGDSVDLQLRGDVDA
jgi:hypothetical protein